MQIVIFGSGNVATVLGRLCKQKGHQIVQVISRNALNARVLADELHCAYTDYNGQVDLTAGLYIIAIADTALQELNPAFSLGNKPVVHTAGSVSREVLKGIAHNYGVIYPMQSLRKEMPYETVIPFLIDGNTPETITFIEDFAKTLSPIVALAGDEERLKLHVSAVMVSNFTNHLYALAEDFCKHEQVDFALLAPLIRETAIRATTYSPSTVQTGPAVRNDMFTIEKHLRVLNGYPKLKNIYIKLTESIMKG